MPVGEISIFDWVAVVSGGLVTLVILAAVLYWIDQEWRERDSGPPAGPLPGDREQSP